MGIPSQRLKRRLRLRSRRGSFSTTCQAPLCDVRSTSVQPRDSLFMSKGLSNMSGGGFRSENSKKIGFVLICIGNVEYVWRSLPIGKLKKLFVLCSGLVPRTVFIQLRFDTTLLQALALHIYTHTSPYFLNMSSTNHIDGIYLIRYWGGIDPGFEMPSTWATSNGFEKPILGAPPATGPDIRAQLVSHCCLIVEQSANIECTHSGRSKKENMVLSRS